MKRKPPAILKPIAKEQEESKPKGEYGFQKLNKMQGKNGRPPLPPLKLNASASVSDISKSMHTTAKP